MGHGLMGRLGQQHSMGRMHGPRNPMFIRKVRRSIFDNFNPQSTFHNLSQIPDHPLPFQLCIGLLLAKVLVKIRPISPQ